jgi:hypothetical protein
LKTKRFHEVLLGNRHRYWLKSRYGKVSSFDDPTRRAILRHVRTVCMADTWLLVVEYVVGPPNEDPYTKLLDLAMLLRTGGAQSTREEWAALFAAGGFHLARITPSLHGPCVLEGVPV